METAQDILSKLILITNSTQNSKSIQPKNKDHIDTALEIRKFKSLLDDGIITQEEFDAKKKQLLGI